MTTASYHGHARTAALHLLAKTPLSAMVDTVRADIVPGDHVLTITVPLHAASHMSSGESLLLDFLLSLGKVGTVNIGTVNIGRLLMVVDADCARVVAESMRLAVGCGVAA